MSARDVIARAILDDADFADVGSIDLAEFPSCTRRANTILTALAAAGYAVVPVEPTREMLLAAPGRTNQATEESMYHGIYRAMLAAAKEPQV